LDPLDPLLIVGAFETEGVELGDCEGSALGSELGGSEMTDGAKLGEAEGARDGTSLGIPLG
jgi:hypothetical protein